MNRKRAIKSIAAFLVLGGVSGAVYEYFNSGEPVPLKMLRRKKELIAELAELIIPRTNTPGAKDAKVEDFIIKMISENTDTRDQNTFLAGLGELEHYTAAKYNKLFIHCNKNQQTEVLKYFEDKADYSLAIVNKVNKKIFGTPFFFRLRDLTAKGYCTSFLGATEGMAYDYIPINYEACIPLKENQLAWATK